MVFLTELHSLSAISWVIAFVVAYFVSNAFYSIYLSPLKHVPGHFWARVSTIPSFYHAAKGDRHIWIWRQFQIYGDTIRVTPNIVVFKSSTAFRDIYSAKANVTRARPYEIWQRSAEDVNTLNTSDVDIHRSKRRLLNLVFTEKSLRSAEEFVIRHVDRWIEVLPGDSKAGEWSEPVNISNWSNFLAFDIMGDLSFGVQFDTKERRENQFKDVPHTIHEYMKFTYPVGDLKDNYASVAARMLNTSQITKSPLIDFLLWAKPRGLDALMNAITPPEVKHYYKFVEDSVRKRQRDLAAAKEKGLTTTGARQDMFHYLCEVKHPDHGGSAYNDQELLAEANLLIIAGSDSTAIQLSGFFFYITHSPRCYDKLVAEIRNAFSSAEDIRQGPKLSSCTYLRACLDKAMRLTPPGPAELGRLVLPGGQMIEGHHYPEGVVVGASMWSSARHEDLGDPFVYRPERWIVDEKNGVTVDGVRLVKSIVHPFSAGASNCVGQNLAILELLITLGRTLWRCDVRNEPGSTLGQGHPSMGWGMRDPKQFMVKDYYTSARDGPMIQLRKRDIKTLPDSYGPKA